MRAGARQHSWRGGGWGGGRRGNPEHVRETAQVRKRGRQSMRAVGPKNKQASATGQVPATGNGQKASHEDRNSAKTVGARAREAKPSEDETERGEGSEGEMGWDAREFLRGLHVWQLWKRAAAMPQAVLWLRWLERAATTCKLRGSSPRGAMCAPGQRQRGPCGPAGGRGRRDVLRADICAGTRDGSARPP